MARGHQLARALQVATALGIADLLANGPRPSEDLARATGTQPAALHRLLRLLASRGVLDEMRHKGFGLAGPGRLLRRDVAGSVREKVLHWGVASEWEPWLDLLHSLRTGEPAAPREAIADAAHGADLPPLRPATGAEPPDDDLSWARTVVDLSSDGGQTLIRTLLAAPHLDGVLVRTQGLDEARRRFAGAGVADRLRVCTDDPFVHPPPPGDLYLLADRLREHEANAASALLRRSAEAMNPRARLAVIEDMIPADNRPTLSQLDDLTGLVVTGGRVRSAREYERLFTVVGLTPTRAFLQPSGRTVMEARSRARSRR